MIGYLGGVPLCRSTAVPNAVNFVLPKRTLPSRARRSARCGAPWSLRRLVMQPYQLRHYRTVLDQDRPVPSIDGFCDRQVTATFDVAAGEALNSVYHCQNSLRARSDCPSDIRVRSRALACRSRRRPDPMRSSRPPLRQSSLPPSSKLEFEINLVDLHRVLLGIWTPRSRSATMRDAKSACADYVETSALAALH